MLKRIVHIGIIFLLFIQCNQSESVEEPQNLIPKNTFENILLDVNLLEGYLTNINVNVPNVRVKSLGKYKSIIEKYNVSSRQYKESYNYYIQQSYFKEMQQKVLDSLTVMEEELKNAPDKQEMTFDQFVKLMEDKAISDLLKNDSIKSKEAIDSMESFYNLNMKKLEEEGIDSIAFTEGMERLRENDPLYKTLQKRLIEDLNKKEKSKQKIKDFLKK